LLTLWGRTPVVLPHNVRQLTFSGGTQMVVQATESAEYIESAAHFSWSETGYVGFDVEFSEIDQPGDQQIEPAHDHSTV
jgi:hypothetical protein